LKGLHFWIQNSVNDVTFSEHGANLITIRSIKNLYSKDLANNPKGGTRSRILFAIGLALTHKESGKEQKFSSIYNLTLAFLKAKKRYFIANGYQK